MSDTRDPQAEIYGAIEQLLALLGREGHDPRDIAEALFLVGAGGMAFDPRSDHDLDAMRRVARELQATIALAESERMMPVAASGPWNVN